MSAVAALTAGDHYTKAFAAGVRWGLGHSTGLFVVAVIFLSCQGQLDLDKVRGRGKGVTWVRTPGPWRLPQRSAGCQMRPLGVVVLKRERHVSS